MIDLAPATPVDAAAVDAFLAPIAQVDDLAATPQDAAVHAEGDVWTHTQMAIQALVDGAAYAALAPRGRRIVSAAVLLHDIGKPATTRDEGGKLTSRGHSAKGETRSKRCGISRRNRSRSREVRCEKCAASANSLIPLHSVPRSRSVATMSVQAFDQEEDRCCPSGEMARTPAGRPPVTINLEATPVSTR